MSFVKQRGEFSSPFDQVNLTVQFRGQDGLGIDTDSFPKISIVQPSGGVFLAPTSVGVSKLGTGKYGYTMTIPFAGPYGAWNDVWVGFVNGYRVETTFSFVVSVGQMPSSPNSDGFEAIGDAVGFDYSQNAIHNINILLKMLKARLNSSGKALAKDQYGNDIYVDCDIYSIDMLVSFLAMAVEEFNAIPYFSFFSLDDTAFVSQFGSILVQLATVYALASMALIERGRAITVTDNGINFALPDVADLLSSQYSAELANITEKVKMIKNSLRPSPLGLGTWSATSGRNPAFARLRHLRARKIY